MTLATSEINTTIDELKESLKTKLLQVTFVKKKDGDIRVMNCTTAPTLTEGTLKGTGRPASANTIVPVFDVDVKEWRCFDFNSILTIQEIGEFEA